MIKTSTLALLALAALSPLTVSAETPAWQHDFAEARRQAQQSGRPMLLHFYADWCFPCKRMEKDVLSRPAVVQVLSSRLILVKVNVDKNPDLAKRFGVSQYPADVIVDPNGDRILTSTGYQEADKYVTFARHAEQQYHQKLMPVATQERTPNERPDVMVALDGYCPVTLAQTRTWKKGSEQFVSEHRGQVYYFMSSDQKTAFDADSRRYVPRLLGCDPVILRDTDLAVPGSVRYGAFYDDELYLFSSSENRTAFKEEPERYTRTRVVRSADEIDRTVLR